MFLTVFIHVKIHEDFGMNNVYNLGTGKRENGASPRSVSGERGGEPPPLHN